MAIVYDPSELLKQYAPKSKVKKIVSTNLTIKKTALNTVTKASFIDSKAVNEVALKSIKNYKKRAKGNPDLKKSLASDPKQLINNVQNAVLYEIKETIKSKYLGEFYEWLPSDADEPDPEHQLLYGTIRIVGDGEMPGDRYGCKCGMRILTEDEKLNL